MDARARWTAIGIAGVGMGLLGNLPLLNFVNCILCIWAWLGGAMAVVLYRRSQAGTPVVSTGQGAGLGALAGLVGAIVGVITYLLTASLSAPLMTSMMQTLNMNLPTGMQNPGSVLGWALILLVIDLVLYPLFGGLGGLITANILKPKPADPTAGHA